MIAVHFFIFIYDMCIEPWLSLSCQFYNKTIEKKRQTFVVDIGWKLYITACCVHWQIIEMLIWLQNEFIPKWHIITLFILFINQNSIVIIKLEVKKNTKMNEYIIFNS